MRVLYFDCFNGIAGDMILGAMLDAGLPADRLASELKKLGVNGYSLDIKKKWQTIGGTDFKVIIENESCHKSVDEIVRLIDGSSLSSFVKELSSRIFRRLGEAEGVVHGCPLSEVHFHEVGDTDAIVDIVGAAIGLEYFVPDSILSSPIPFCRGEIKCAHGRIPNPAPATVELLKGVRLESSDIGEEIVTPTGAAIITTIAQQFGESPLQKIENVGYGFGDKEVKGKINALRLFVGEGFPVVVIETNIDDMNPQLFDHVVEKLFENGAVDVVLHPVQMKKNRPAVMLSCQSPWEKKDELIDIIFRETTTFGVRYYPVERKVLTRELKTVLVDRKSIRMKQGFDDEGNLIKEIPEYEDVKLLAKERSISLQSAYGLILKSV